MSNYCCRKCGTALNIATNWSEHRKHKCDYICDNCLKICKQQHYSKHKKEYKVKHRDYYVQNKDSVKHKVKKYQQSVSGKKVLKKCVLKYRKANQNKLNARCQLNRAVVNGVVSRPDICEVCKQRKKIEAHHPDYNKPLEVVWVCRSCHNELYY